MSDPFAIPSMTSSETTSPHSYRYRPDVDGLRALAILPVILYHADLGFSGGFVGVDIFFVISGYLITSLILKELVEGRFGLAAFWERRIRRILPAMSVVILAIIAGGWFFFLPDDFVSVGKTVVAQALLMSNLFFALHTGYFEDASDTKPMLHMWSLAVEEQFYVLFPLFLVLVARSKKLSVFWLTAALAVASFALSIAGTYLNQDATFFILPTRAWELMAGALLAAMPGRVALKHGWMEAAALAGFGLILLSIFFYTRNTRFPGLAAMPPCLGAVLIIFSGSARPTTVGKWLSLKPVVFIGLISYSLYLWHWPVLVFSKYATPGIQTWQVRAGLLGICLGLAILSWRFVETPFRKKALFARRPQIFGLAAVSFVTLLIAGGGILATHGMPGRLNARASQFAGFRNDRGFRPEITVEEAVAGKFAELGGKDAREPAEILVWGDSHAMSVTPAIDDLCRRFSVRGLEATHSSTAPALGYLSQSPFSLREKSPAFSQAVVDYVLQHHIKSVVIAASWKSYGPPEELDAKLTATAKTLLASGSKVYVLKDVPIPYFDVPRHAALTVMHHGNPAGLAIPQEKYQADIHDCEFIFDHLARLGVTVLDTSKYFLNTNNSYDVVSGDQALYWDWNHLSMVGSKRLIPMFEPLFSGVVAAEKPNKPAAELANSDGISHHKSP
jgi:peptidoglycan/LPS O-acetylase OafA/YrhL